MSSYVHYYLKKITVIAFFRSNDVPVKNDGTLQNRYFFTFNYLYLAHNTPK